jgi:hypothetical protein
MSDNHIDPQKSDTAAGNTPAQQPSQTMGVLKCADNGKGYYIHEDGRVEEINDIHFLKRLAWMPTEPTSQEGGDKNDH